MDGMRLLEARDPFERAVMIALARKTAEYVVNLRDNAPVNQLAKAWTGGGS